MKLSDTGAAIIEEFEGFSSAPYRDSVGVWTIGFGSTKGVGPSSPHVTRAQASVRLQREVDAEYGAAVNALHLLLNQNQFDALVSFVYNVGPGGIASTTTVGKRLRAHDWSGAANALLAWDKAGGRALPGLTRRRHVERSLFLKPVDALAGYTESESRWIREFDHLSHLGVNAARRKTLRYVMKRQAQAIEAAAKKTGWDRANRRHRYRSLAARSGLS